MVLPLLPLAAVAVTGAAGLTFASVLPDSAPEEIREAIPGGSPPDGSPPGGDSGRNLLIGIAAFIAALVFGNTIIKELL